MGTKKNMRFVISENRLNDIILNFINNYYDVDEIHSSPFHDEDGNPTNKAIEYYLGDYSDDQLYLPYTKKIIGQVVMILEKS